MLASLSYKKHERRKKNRKKKKNEYLCCLMGRIYAYLPKHGSKWLKNMLFTRNSETHIVIEPKLFFSFTKQALELRSRQEPYWDNVSATVFTYIHDKVSFGDALVVLMLFSTQAWTLLHYVLQNCGLRKLSWGFLKSHFMS